jgi:hypothetical protein
MVQSPGAGWRESDINLALPAPSRIATRIRAAAAASRWSTWRGATAALSVGLGGTLALLSACGPVVAVVVGVRRRVGAGRA